MRLIRPLSRRVHLAATCALLPAALLAVSCLRSPTSAGAADAPATTPTTMDPAKVMGAQACIECHKPVVEAWQVTKHAVEFDKLRESPNAQNYAKAMGITTAGISKSVCASCHGMRAEATATKTTTGVSCESCHGASGGESGWLNPHGSYGAKGATRDQETPEHREMRFALVDKAGMVRPESIYELARNCYQCHLMVGHEDVVNKGGHHAGSAEFELVSWMHGEIDHNLFIDPKTNAKGPSLALSRLKKTPQERDRVLYVAGKLAAFEISLRNLAASTTEDSFMHAMASHARAYRDDLSDIKDSAEVPEIAKVVQEFTKYRRKLTPANKDELTKYADEVSKAAQEFVKKHDGSKLDGLDSLVPTNVKGKRFQPK